MNRLIHESSPYLLQHAHNPVDWYPWGPEALERAVRENKPILVSIGYAACHWCHVMERESFEVEETAALMNAHFINIKIDREERPDLDHIYMDAVQAMSGSGGWPLNVFLTPAGKPFYGGTYFPPRPAFNRPSWSQVLESVAEAWKNRPHEMEAQGENLTEHLKQSNRFGQNTGNTNSPSADALHSMAANILATADKQWGGFGRAPKFPQTFTILYLIRYAHYCRTKLKDENGSGLDEHALQQALLSLDKMIEGGIYDQAGGGFARYSTDTEWLAPHFEKMLYDNALLIVALSEAYQFTRKNRYREVIEETFEFLEREMLHPGGGFYAALDADSEGVEGKFYVWDLAEVKELLGEDAAVFCRYYDITEQGNWEHKNILRVLKPFADFAREEKINEETLRKILLSGRNKLMERRAGRIRPQLDDKIILGWNALMNTACSKAFACTGHEKYREMAVRNMEFLLKAFRAANPADLFHTWKNDQARYPAFLDDYAYLIEALIYLQEITGNTNWLEEARRLTEFVLDQFAEEEGSGFYFTRSDQKDVIVRKKEVYDGAVPSGNAVMAVNLAKLAVLLDRPDWNNRSHQQLMMLEQAVIKYPGSFGVWAGHYLNLISGLSEIVITGEKWQKGLQDVLSVYIPNRVIMASSVDSEDYPLLRGKKPLSIHTYFLCRNYACAAPVFSLDSLITLINRP